MHKIFSWYNLFFVLFVLICFGTDFPTAIASDPKVTELSQQKLPPIQEPDIQVKTLANGMTVYYLQDTELPLFHMSTFFEVGSIYDTEASRGIAGFFMAAWRGGGAEGLPAKDIDAKLDFYAAKISSNAGDELSTFDVECLQKDMQPILDIYYKLLRHPAFEADRIEIIRKGALNGITRRNEEPMPIAMREFSQSLYGQKSPHAWMSTPETIKSIDQPTLKKYFDANVGTNRTWIAATSPLGFDDFLNLITPYISDWNKSVAKKDYPTHITKTWQPSVEFIQKSGNQSAIVIGHFGEKRFSPDKYKLILANEILGGSTFGSKLGDRIRTELGLAYGVESDFGFTSDYGEFAMATRTKSESTVSAIKEMERILTDMVANKNIKQDELDLARERIINRLVFEYESPFNIVVNRVRYDYYGYPPNYLALFQKEVEKITLDDVKQSLAQYFFPNKLKLMIIGDRTQIPDLNQLPGLVEKPLDME